MSEVLTRPTTLRPAQPLDAGAVGGIMSDFARDTNWLPRIHTAAEDIAHADAMIARGFAFYRHHGFAETARGDGSANDEGLPDLTLHWQREAA